jgi:hypothetical protein
MTKRKTVKRAGRKIPRPKPESNGQLIDGTITIEVQGGPHDGKTITMSASIVNDAVNELLTKLKIKPDADGLTTFTPEFKIALDKRLQELGYESTVEIAMSAQEKAFEYWTSLQKKTS